MNDAFTQAVAWLTESSRATAAVDFLDLGREFYRRLTGRIPPAAGPVPAVAHRGLDQMVMRLICPAVEDRYPDLASLQFDLTCWDQPDFVAATGVARPRPAEPALIGRDSQLEQLTDPGFTVLVGPAGMGKTRLLDEAVRRALADGWTVWRTECLERTHQEFQPVSDLAAQLARHSQHWPAVRARMGDWLGPAVRLFPILRGLGHDPEAGEAEFVAERNREACLRLLAALASKEQPALILVDDLHWAQPEVRAVLLQLAGKPHLRVLGAARAPLEGADRNLVLQPLDEIQVQRLARSMCGPVECQPLYEWSQGHPLLAASLVRNLCESGALVQSGARWCRSQREPTWGKLSPSLEELLCRRVETLSPAGREVLRQAALLGRRFELELLECAEPSAALREGEQNGLVFRIAAGGWDFTHDLIHQELYRATSGQERAAFHGRVAARLLERPQPPAEALAHHLWESGRAQDCLPWAVLAAQNARTDGALESAVHFWQRATRIQPESHLYWFELGETLRLLGRYPEAQHALRCALPLSLEPWERARTHGKLGETCWRAGDLEAAADHFRQGLYTLGFPVPTGLREWLAILGELRPRAIRPKVLSPGEKLAARLLDQLSYTTVYSAGVGPVWANLRGLRLTAGAPGRERGLLLASHAVLVLYVPALIARSQRSIDQAVQILSEHGSDHDQACALGRLGAIRLFTGRLEEAVQASGTALTRLILSGDRYDVRMTRYNLAYGLYWLGKTEAARQLAEEGWAEASRARDWLAAAHCARVLAALGLVPHQFYQHFEQPGSQPHVECLRLEVRGLLQLVRGRPEAAAHDLRAALARSTRLKISLEKAWQSSWLATAYRMQAELAPLAHRHDLYRQGLRAARQACQLGRAGYSVYLPHALRELGWCELGLGGSTRGFDQSLEAAQRLGMVLQARITEADRCRAGLAKRQNPSPNPFWQLTPPLASAQRLAHQFDQAVQHARGILEATTAPEVLVRTDEAARVLLGAESCQATPLELENPLIERQPERSGVRSSLLMPLGVHWGQALTMVCVHRQLPDRFGEEELQLAAFLGTVAAAALDNAGMLEELRGREQWLARLFEAVPVGVASLDQEGRILQANAALQEMLGPELVGRKLSDFLHRGPGDSCEERYLGKGGNLIWADRRSARLGPDRTVVSLADISWRRLAQVAAFQERERRLLGIEVHDVSQPLVGLSYQLRAQGDSESAELAHKLLRELRSLMFDLRTPNLEEHNLALSLTDLVQEVCSMSSLECRVEVPPSLEVSGLAGLFAYRIVVEGMSNVRRHSGAGAVLLRLRLVGRELRGSLCDDGPGREDTSSRRRYGLQGISERAELLGGWARLRRLPGRGSLLHFRLPLEEP